MIIFTLDVLALPGLGIGQRQPSPEGRKLWNIFERSQTGAMCLIVNGLERFEHLQAWLQAEGFRPDYLDTAADNRSRTKYERASALRAAMGKCDWFIDTDPAAVALALDEGIPSLLVASPYVARPDWRTRERVGWDQLVDRMGLEHLRAAAAANDDDDE